MMELSAIVCSCHQPVCNCMALSFWNVSLYCSSVSHPDLDELLRKMLDQRNSVHSMKNEASTFIIRTLNVIEFCRNILIFHYF